MSTNIDDVVFGDLKKKKVEIQPKQKNTTVDDVVFGDLDSMEVKPTIVPPTEPGLLSKVGRWASDLVTPNPSTERKFGEVKDSDEPGPPPDVNKLFKRAGGLSPYGGLSTEGLPSKPSYTGKMVGEVLTQFGGGIVDGLLGLFRLPVSVANAVTKDTYPALKEKEKDPEGYKLVGGVPIPNKYRVPASEEVYKPLPNIPYVSPSKVETLPGIVAGTTGKVIGSIPEILIGAKAIDIGIKGAIAYLPPVAAKIASFAVRSGFLVDSAINTISSAKEFVQGVSTGDHTLIRDAAANGITSALFTYLLSKGYKTDAENLVKDIKKDPANPPTSTEPSDELRADADTKNTGEMTAEVNKQIKEKKVRTPAQVAASKANLEKARAAKGKKVEVVQPTPEPVTNLDLQTGTPTPEGLTGDNHPLRQPGTDAYDGVKIVDPGTALHKAINDVNRWLDGNDEVDINQVRNDLSDLATDAESFKDKFGIYGITSEEATQSFNGFKELAVEATKWARNIDRVKITQTDVKPTDIIPEKIPGSPEELVITGKDFDEMETYYGRSLDEISDVEIREFIKNRPRVEAKAEEDFTPEELAELEKPDTFEKKPTKKLPFTAEQQAELDKLIRMPGKVKPAKIPTQTVPAEPTELERLIAEQGEDQAVTERMSRRRRTRTSLYMGLPLDEAAGMMKTWYSQLREYAVEKLGNKGTREQILATLRKGSTQDEWKNVNLEGMLPDKPVLTKQEVLKVIDEGTVEFRDVELRSRLGLSEEEIARHRYLEQQVQMGSELSINEFIELENLIAKRNGDATKFSSYVEPGGTNYREAFVTAPLKQEKSVFKNSRYEDLKWKEEREKITPEEQTELDNMRWEGATSTWQDGHPDYSDIENPIVRLRMNDRVDVQGNKVLFIEELQGPNPENQAKMPEYLRKRIREIGMKRAIKYAIDGGYDKLAWTTGEMQAKRYSLDKVINQLDYGKNNDGTYWLTTGGNTGVDYSTIKEVELDNFVGPEIANKIRSGEGSEYSTGLGFEPEGGVSGKRLSNIDLKTENKGLRKLYDQDLPNVAKKLGGEVEETKIGTNRNATIMYAHGANDLGEYKVIDGRQILGTFQDKAEAVNFSKLVKEGRTVPSISISPLRAKATKGFSMYSGVDPVKGVSTLADMVKGWRKSDKDYDEHHKFDPKLAWKVTRDSFSHNWISQVANIRRELIKYGDKGADLLQSYWVSKGGHPRATIEFKQMQKDALDGYGREDKKILFNLNLAQRMLAISKSPKGKKFKYPEDWTPDKSQVYVDGFGSKAVNGVRDLTVDEIAKFKNSSQIMFDYVKRAVKFLREKGVISENEMNDLINYNYQRLKVATPDLAGIYDRGLGKSGMDVLESGIDPLAAGKKTNMFERNSELLVLETLNRLYSRAYRNIAWTSLKDLSISDPKNPFVMNTFRQVEELKTKPTKRGAIRMSVEIKAEENGLSDFDLKAKMKTMFKKGNINKLSVEELKLLDNNLGPISKQFVKGSGAKKPTGWVPETGYINGVQKSVFLNPEFAKEWIAADPQLTGKFANFVRFWSGSQLTKAFATGINPIFALRNLPRDVMQLWFAARTFENGKWTGVYSDYLPVFGAEISADIKDVFKDALYQTGKYKDYINDGFGMDMLTIQGRPFRKGLQLERPIDKLYDVLGYMNNVSEVAPRLAIRDRVIKTEAEKLGITYEEAYKDPKIRQKAGFAAFDYMNFKDGGTFSKALDTGIPYFNARIVGLRSFLRTFKDPGSAASSAMKISQLAMLVSGMKLATQQFYPNTAMDLEGDFRLNNNFVIPLGDSFGMEIMGEMRYPFFMIPVDQSVRPFKVMFEEAINWHYGQKVNFDRLRQSVADASPVDTSSILPPTISAGIGYMTGKNTYTWKDIFPAEKQLPLGHQGAEINYVGENKTPQLYRNIGEATELSPERLRYVAGQLITKDNVYLSLMNWGYNKLFSDLPVSQRKQFVSEILSKTSGTKSFFGLTSPGAKFREGGKDIKTQAIVNNIVEHGALDSRIEQYMVDKTMSRDQVMDYIMSLPERKDRDAAREDLKFAERVENLPNREFWSILRRMPDLKSKAEFYLERKNSLKTQQEELQLFDEEVQINKIGGILSKEFRKEVNRQSLK